MSNTDFTPEQRANILSKIDKLMRTAGTTEAEAASRIAKAQEFLAQYNLTMDDVAREGGEGGQRAEEMLRGGFYQWERDLWQAVSSLNFCLAIRWWYYKIVTSERKGWDGTVYTKQRNQKVFQTRLIGRKVNIMATKNMVGYLLNVTRRLTRERLHGDNSQMLSAWAISFQEGITARVIEKLEDRRRAQLTEEREKARAAAKMAMQGASTETALTLASYSRSEADANADFVYGEGFTAKQAKARADRAAYRRMDEADRTQWAAEHPEEAAQYENEARASRRYRGGSAKEERQKDWGAFKAGYAAGEDVSIDQQADQRKPAGSLGNG